MKILIIILLLATGASGQMLELKPGKVTARPLTAQEEQLRAVDTAKASVIQSNLTAQAEARAAALAELNLTPTQVNALKTWLAADTDVLFSNLNAQQRAYLRVQHEIVRYLIKDKLAEKLQ